MQCRVGWCGLGLIRLRVGPILWAFENPVLGLLIPQKVWNFLTSWVTVSLSGRKDSVACNWCGCCTSRRHDDSEAWRSRVTIGSREGCEDVWRPLRVTSGVDRIVTEIRGFKVARVKCFIFGETVVWACFRCRLVARPSLSISGPLRSWPLHVARK